MTITMRVRMADAQREIAAMQAQIQKLNSTMAMAGAAGAGGFGKNMMNARRHMERFGKNMQWVGRQIEFNFTLPLAIAGGFATKWALDNERNFTRLRKVYNEAENDSFTLNQELSLLGRGFRALSDIMGVHQDEVISVGAMWAQAGATGVGLLRSTKNTLDLMILGEMEAVEATEALIAIQSQWGLSSAELTQQIAYLNHIENETATSMEGLVQALARGGGVAREAGLSIREFAAMVAAISPAAGTAAQAGNGLRTMITRVMSPTNAAAGELESLGINIDRASWQSKTFTERIKDIARALEGMGQQARTDALTELGSRWQVNRLSVLMRDLNNAMDDSTLTVSRFGKAMETTEDGARSMMVARRELQILLASTPRGFKILTTQIKNLASEIIQPLLPVMVAFLATVRDWIKAFTDLPPATQKNILMWALFIMILGPVIRYMGATILLASQLMGAFRFLGAVIIALMHPIRTFGILMGFLAKVLPVEAIATAASVVWTAFTWMFGAIITSATWFGRQMMVVFTAMWKGLARLHAFAAPRIVAAMSGAWSAMVAGFATAAQHVLRVALLLFRGLATIFARALSALLWRIIIPGMIAIIGALTSPVGIAIAAVAVLVIALVMLWRRFPEEMERIVRWLGDVVMYIPRLFVKMGEALAQVFRQIIKMVVEFFSWLNPFQRHSPSLVDNVTRGVDRIASEFAKLRHIGQYFRSATRELEIFKAATEDARKRFRMEEFAELRESVVAGAPNAGSSFDRMVMEVERLRGQLKLLNVEIQAQAIVVNDWRMKLDAAEQAVKDQSAALEELRTTASDLSDAINTAQQAIDGLANMDIEGMRAYSDALFENDQAQKQLRLSILELEAEQRKSGQTTEDLRNRLAALSGEIEMLSGQREDLRLAGAGSDILKAYDKQIGAMEEERKKLMQAQGDQSGPNAELDQLRAQLEELQAEAEMLNLRESLEFDPLRREISDLVNGIEELPFDVIVDGIKAHQEVIAELQPQLDAVNAKIKDEEKVLRDLEKARDDIRAAYDREMETLDLLTTAYDDLERQIGDMEAAMRDFASEFEKSADRAAKAAGKAGDEIQRALGDFDIGGGAAGIGEEFGDLKAMVEGLEEEVAAMFGDFDLWAPFKEMWNKGKTWLSEQWAGFREAMRGGWNGVVGIGKGIWLEFGDWLGRKWTEIKDEASTAWSGFTGFWSTLWSNIKLGAQLYWGDFTTWISEEWALFIEGFHNIFDPVGEWWNGIWENMKLGAQGYWSDFTGWIGPEWDQFTKGASNIWTGVKDGFVTKWQQMKEGATTKWREFEQLIEPKIAAFKDRVGTKWTQLKEDAGRKWDSIKTTVGEKVSAMKRVIDENLEAVKSFWAPKLEALRTTAATKWDSIKTTISEKIIGAKKIVNENVQAIQDFWAPKMDAIRTKATDVWGSIASTISVKVSAIKSSVKGMINGVISSLNGLIRAWNRISFTLPSISIPGVGTMGGTTIHTPNVSELPYLARGGVITAPTLAMIGESQRSRPEIVTPERLMRQVFRDEIKSMGGMGGGKQVNFFGDLSFPNVKDGTDAEAFVRNLEAMVD